MTKRKLKGVGRAWSALGRGLKRGFAACMRSGKHNQLSGGSHPQYHQQEQMRHAPPAWPALFSPSPQVIGRESVRSPNPFLDDDDVRVPPTSQQHRMGPVSRVPAFGEGALTRWH
jgi:hypothetical protein